MFRLYNTGGFKGSVPAIVITQYKHFVIIIKVIQVQQKINYAR